MPNQPDLDAATDFVWRKARLIDRHRFAYLFGEGPPGPVVDALRAYQNADGGFGNALEPDLRAPVSQPQPVEHAVNILDEVGAFDDPMLGRALDYLVTVTTPDGGLPFMLPSALPYPRAPWWQTEDDPPAGLISTAAIAGQLHKHGVDHPWLGPATEYCWRTLDAADELLPYDLLGSFVFLTLVPDRARAEALAQRIGARMIEQGHVTLDPDADGPVFFPLDFAPEPGNVARSLFADDVIEAHLDALVGQQQPDGGWRFNFPEWNALTTLEWRGFLTVARLQLFRAYGRIA